MEMVRTLFRKYDGRPHRLMEPLHLGEDDHGLWVGSRPGDRAQRADGTWINVDHTRVRLFPRGQWWSALFNDAPHPTEIYCDITMPPASSPLTLAGLVASAKRTRSDGVE